MIHGPTVVIVLPAYRAEQTLRQTVEDLPREALDLVLLVDDASDDGTLALAAELGLRTFVHRRNMGYGANQKSCYELALGLGADIVVMLHPDYQYEPRLVAPMAAMVASGVYDVVLGSRMLGKSPLAGGMPLYKYLANRCLTALENRCLGVRLSEFHTGYRAYSRRVLEALPLLANSDDFLFDNQVLAEAVAAGFSIGEISCPARYFPEASTIGFWPALRYGAGVLATCAAYLLWKWGFTHSPLFDTSEKHKIGSGESRRGRLYTPLGPESAAGGRLETPSADQSPPLETAQRLAGARK
jgi:glycosyltransferase involved in cell wall biosynthesis